MTKNAKTRKFLPAKVIALRISFLCGNLFLGNSNVFSDEMLEEVRKLDEGNFLETLFSPCPCKYSGTKVTNSSLLIQQE